MGPRIEPLRVWLGLAAAVGLDTAGTLALRAADGTVRPGWLVVMAVGYVGSLYFLSHVVTRMPVGPAYGIYSAGAVALTTVLGGAIFHDRLGRVAVLGLVLVVVGVFVTQVGTRRTPGRGGDA